MIYISTNMFKPENTLKVFNITKSIDFEIGIELFFMSYYYGYIKLIKDNLEEFKKYKITFHEDYNLTEHSEDPTSKKSIRTEKYYTNMLEIAKELNPKYIVYHYNNKKVDNREKMLEITRKNLDYFSNISKYPLLIENVGIAQRENFLLNEEEFIEECLKRKEDVLIDIGHANANSWNLENVLSKLQNKIKSYHIHTNDGIHDEHCSIFDKKKTPDIINFLKLYKKYTPNADLVIEYLDQYDSQIELVIDDIKRLKEML